MKIDVKKIGGLWHGTVEGTDIHDRGLTAEIAERKARQVLERRTQEGSSREETIPPPLRTKRERRRRD